MKKIKFCTYTIRIGLKVFLFDEIKEKKENDNNCEQSFIFFTYMILFSIIKQNFGLSKESFYMFTFYNRQKMLLVNNFR